MWVQPKTNAQQEGEFFPDNSSARPLVPHTVARGFLREDDVFFTGAKGNKWVSELPMQLTEDLLKRGKERFTIYCTPCHGQLGDGNGMVAQRGFAPNVKVASYHTDRLRKMPIGHFYDVMTNGYGRMFSYASRIEPQDRWAIAAYVRVLQLSQHASPQDLSDAGLHAENAAHQGEVASR
jgi:mono/diheme cytochrome c family protein